MRKSWRIGRHEVTIHELLASVTIIAVMMILGFVFDGKIEQHQTDKNAEYYKAAKITDPDQFRYGMDTSIGNAFVYGDLEAVDPVTFPEIGGEYLYVEKVEEHYNMHTRTVTRTVNGKTQTRTETYWTWDYAGSEKIHSQKIRFCDVEMDYSKVDRPFSNYIETIKKSVFVRYRYYGCETKYTGTIYTDLRDGTIKDDSKFYDDKNIDSCVEHLTSNKFLWIFRIVWSLLTIGAVIEFVRLDNKWLE